MANDVARVRISVGGRPMMAIDLMHGQYPDNLLAAAHVSWISTSAGPP
ncbi:hypothetical protein ACU4GD_00215 [Cupriavidus basilensis]